MYTCVMSRTYYVYIMASRKNGTLYIGVTGNLERRVLEHKEGTVEGFTSEHKVNRLVYYEATNEIDAAIQRETQLKKWNRDWKIRLIEGANPQWDEIVLR